MLEILCAIIAGAAGIAVAIVEARSARERKNAETLRKRTEERALQRAEESRLSMELISANCKLSCVTAKAVTGQKTNGDIIEALESAAAALKKYESYLMELAAQQAVKI